MSHGGKETSPASNSESSEPPGGIDGHGRREFLKATNVLALGGLFTAEPTRGGNAPTASESSGKTRSTLYTPDRRSAARENADRYTWAANRRKEAVETADEYREAYEDIDGLWRAVTAQTVPRSISLSDAVGDNNPQNGAAVYEMFGTDPLNTTPTRRPWELVDSTPEVGRQDITFPAAQPWKLVEPATGGVFPTNDFAAYRESGLDDRGTFDPALADDSLLVNEERPDKPDNWGVDDGTGWVDEDGELGVEGARYHFVAYYNRVYRWEYILDAVRAFRDAYLFTDDVAYARAGTVLVDRIADIYPEMDISVYRYDDGYVGIHEWTGQGKIGGCVEETVAIRVLLSAYDAFFPAMTNEDLLAFLGKKAEEYNVGNKAGADDVRRNIEENVVQAVLPAVQNHQIHSLSGGHRTALAMSAAVQDDPGSYTGDAVEFLLRSGERTHRRDGSYWGKWWVTGGDLLSELVDKVDRDGNHKGSPAASEAAFQALQDVTAVLDDYEGYDGPTVGDHPSVERAAGGRVPQILHEKYLSRAGSMGRTGNPWLPIETEAMTRAFESFGNERFAKAAFLVNGYSYDGMHDGVFTEDPEAVAESVQEVIDADGPLELSSTNQVGTGLAVLRDGEHYIRGGYRVVGQFPSMTVLDHTTDYTVYSGSGTVQFEADTAGQSINFEFSVPVTETYEFTLKPFKSTGYGIYEVLIDGETVGEHDFYRETIGVGDDTVIADGVELSEGTHRLTFENVGKRDAATNYKMGVITATFLDERAQRERELEAERGNTQRSISIQYGASTPDGPGTYGRHRDALHVDVHAYGGDLAPDLGYPEQTGFWPHPDSPGDSSTWPKGEYWTTNTISHNTVVVDEAPQAETGVGSPLHFAATDRVSIADVESPDAYPGVDQYRRTTAMVRIDEQHSYAVDFFRVEGGDDHCFSFHGAAGSAATNGLDLVDQDGGTYAGPDVPRPAYGESSDYDREGESGFDYLDNVARDGDPGERFSVDWDVTDAWDAIPDRGDVHLRLTMVSDVDEVALADGRPPRHPGVPRHLRYALARRQGSNVDSTFTSVLEPYRGDRSVESIEAVPTRSGDDAGRAVKVALANGRTDYVAYAPGESICVVSDKFQFDGFLAVYSEREGEPTFAHVEDGSMLAPVRDGPPLVRDKPGAYEGVIEDFTRNVSRTNEFRVRLTKGPQRGNVADELAGTWLYVETDAGVQAYHIEDATANQGNQMTLNVGEQTTVARFADSSDPDAGYEYTIEERARFRVPLSRTWVQID